MSESIDYVLSSLGIRPILVDIGASGAPPAIWQEIARHSVYIGFDPDLRDLQREVSDTTYSEFILVNKALTHEKDGDRALFHLTKSPHCSSTLRPDSKSLSNYLFSDLFEVEEEVSVQTASLDSVMEQLSLTRIHWFKTDSQGTDLRLIDSMREEIRSRVLVADIEPGLIDAYIGEDLFVDAHRYLTQNGFWLSNLNVEGSVRMRESTVREVVSADLGIDRALLKMGVRRSPGWCEARYLRTIDWLSAGGFPKEDYALLWAFALLDDQIGFALDIAIEHDRVFGADEMSRLMWDEAISIMMRSGNVEPPRRTLPRVLRSAVPQKARRWLSSHFLKKSG